MRKMSYKQSMELKVFQYKNMLSERRGHNYSYYSEKLQTYIDDNGYIFHNFDGSETTSVELDAIEIVKQLRVDNYYARIICGVEQNIQRIKMFSVIKKKKK